MTLLRQLLVKLRSWYYGDQRKDVLKKLILVFVAATAAGFTVDFFAPFSGWWTLLRSAILIPIAGSLFMLGYMANIAFKDRQYRNDPDWVPARARYSPRRRLQAAIIGGAVLIVAVYALGPVPGYTFIASAIVSSALGLLAFVRKTSREANRADLGIPDPRDADYTSALDASAKKREERLKTKSNAKAVRRERVLRGRKSAEELERQLENE